jgi:ComF family protein
MVDNWLKIIQSGLLPQHCVLCASPSGDDLALCPDCQRDLPYQTASCQHCALPLQQSGVCGRCQKMPPVFDAAESVFEYRDGIEWLIQGMKFGNKLSHAQILGQLMAEHFTRRDAADLPDVMIPVPLHKDRLKHRGYNQALELARPLVRKLRIALDWQSCNRVTPTAEQSSLPADERRRNVRNAFRFTNAHHYQSVALLDDVMTTGSTVNELATALKQNGVQHVEVWTCARAMWTES